jgi:hypothetical protein
MSVKSGKQRRAQIKAARLQRAHKRHPLSPEAIVRVDPTRLAPDGSYGVPDFVHRGYYVDVAFRCVDRAAEGVWTAQRQKWWYEVAQGGVWTTARRCRACRAKKRAEREAAHAASIAGGLLKLARMAQ